MKTVKAQEKKQKNNHVSIVKLGAVTALTLGGKGGDSEGNVRGHRR